jgi:hypothetical protein
MNTKSCEYCNKKLVKIGYNRSNGKPHVDWNERKYHKKCLKIFLLEDNIKRFLARPSNRFLSNSSC